MAKNKGSLRFNKGGSKKKKQTKLNKNQSNIKIEQNRTPIIDEIDQEEFIVVGKNPVLEALKSDLQVEKVLILKDNTDHVLSDIAKKAKDDNLIVQSVERIRLDQISEGRPHQGVAALMSPYDYKELDDIIKDVRNKENSILVLCDHITDPHNFGAIIRSAEVCGADAVIFPNRRAAGLSPTTVKSSSGAAAYIDLCKVGNLSQVIKKLKANQFWIAGADMDGENVFKTNLKGKLALVLGAEGSGLSPSIKKECDFIVSIPNYGKVDSMNVSCAAAVILAEAAQQDHQ